MYIYTYESIHPSMGVLNDVVDEKQKAHCRTIATSHALFIAWTQAVRPVAFH